MEFPGVDKATIPYIHHFITFCSRFLCYSNDNERNPFQEQLFPQASSSPALLQSMAALAAGHLARNQKHNHEINAATYYSTALRELNATLSDPAVAKSDATLGACLLLCVHEVSQSCSISWDHSCWCNTTDIPFWKFTLVRPPSRSERSNHVQRWPEHKRVFDSFLQLPWYLGFSSFGRWAFASGRLLAWRWIRANKVHHRRQKPLAILWVFCLLPSLSWIRL